MSRPLAFIDPAEENNVRPETEGGSSGQTNHRKQFNMTTANPMTLGQLNSPNGSQAINTRGSSHENIHRKSNKPPSKSISQLDRARKLKQD